MGEKTKTIPDDIKALSFEEGLTELETIVSKLERGDVGLEQSIEIYARGSDLRSHCQEKLKAAQSKIEKIQLSSAGEPTGTEPFDAE
jgi:exodeoxyribonuclease VII small subunit